MSRIQSLDALKGVAIFAVICLHAVQPGDFEQVSLAWQFVILVCRFAVPVFFLISGFFFMRAYRSGFGELSQMTRYIVRLSKPFFFWAFFYAVVPPFVGGMREPVGRMIGDHLGSVVRYPHSFLLTGYVYHLWFLSSLLQAACLVWVCLRFLNLRFALVLGGILYALALMGGAYAESPAGFQVHFDMKNGPFVSTLFFGLGAWLAERGSAFANLKAGWGLLVGGCVLHISEAMVLNHFYGKTLVSYSYLLGTVPFALGIVVLALGHPDWGQSIASPGKYSLGIYLLHPYIIELFLFFSSGIGIPKSPFLFSCVVFAICLPGVAALSRIRWMRPMVI